jgi:hypothetical protein
MHDYIIYVNPCFKTLMIKTNSFNDNPSKQWMIVVAASCIGN